MSLKERIQEDQKNALKEKQQEQLETLRGVWAMVRKDEIDSQKELSDEEVETVIARQVKQLQDAKKDFLSGQRTDLVEKADREIALLSVYLPEQLTDTDLDAIIQTVFAEQTESQKNIGVLMGLVMKQVKGRADGNRVRERVVALLGAR